MIQIRNISPVERVAFSTSSDDEAGRPLRIELGPGEVQFIMQEQLKKWPIHAKSRFAELVEHGSLAVNTTNNAHVAPDRSNRLTFSAIDLNSALSDAINFKTEYNAHLSNSAFHTAADGANLVTSADPTNLATLITLLTEARLDYNAHIVLGASHPFPDAINGVILGVPTDLPTSLALLEELVRRLRTHKLHNTPDGTDALNPIEILTFA
jgi:hypothetical protein